MRYHNLNYRIQNNEVLKRRYYRELKRKRLIKALFFRMVKFFNMEDLNIKLVFKTLSWGSWHSPFYFSSGEISHKISIGISGIKNDIKDGLSGDYYELRPLKLNCHLIGNKKLCLRWILLHELNHAIMTDILKENYHRNMDLKARESLADDFALAYVTQF